MEHQAAVETHAVERYLLGEMPADEREAFEDHYFACVACAEEVRVGAQFRANYDHGEGLTDHKNRWSVPLWLRWPSLIPVAASLVFAGIVWFGARQPDRQALIRSVDDWDPYVAHETERGPSAAVVVIPKTNEPAYLTIRIPDDAPKPPYLCTIQDSNGKRLQTIVMAKPTKPEAKIAVDREHLPPGLFNLRLEKDGTLIQHYDFQLQ
jgi:hypothetical protein